MATNKHRGTCIIDIGGKKRGLIFNMNTYAIFCDGMGIKLIEMESAFTNQEAKSMCWLIYAGCIAYDEKNNQTIDYSIHDFYDWCMNISQEDSQKVLETMVASQTLKNDSNNGMPRNVVKSTKDDVKKN